MNSLMRLIWILLLSILLAASASAEQPWVKPVKVDKKYHVAAPSLSLEIMSFDARKVEGKWFWYLTFKNTDPKRSLPRGRLEIRAFQTSHDLNQDYPAGEVQFNNNLRPGKRHSITWIWDKRQHTTNIRVELWDLTNNRLVASEGVRVASDVDMLSQPTPQGMETGPAHVEVREELQIIDAVYLGRGKWEVTLKNTGTIPIPKNRYRVAAVYHQIPGGKTKDGACLNPELVATQEKTVERSGFYSDDDPDCASLMEVELQLSKEGDAEVIQTFTIPVDIPKVSIDYVEAVPANVEGYKEWDLKGAFTNHSDYTLLLKVKVKVELLRAEVLQTINMNVPLSLEPNDREVVVDLIPEFGQYWNRTAANEEYNLTWRVSTHLVMDDSPLCVIQGTLDKDVAGLIPNYGKRRD